MINDDFDGIYDNLTLTNFTACDDAVIGDWDINGHDSDKMTHVLIVAAMMMTRM